jgi:hypothetical protein
MRLSCCLCLCVPLIVASVYYEITLTSVCASPPPPGNIYFFHAVRVVSRESRRLVLSITSVYLGLFAPGSQDSSVGIATGFGLDGRDLISVRDTRFFSSLQHQNLFWAHPRITVLLISSLIYRLTLSAKKYYNNSPYIVGYISPHVGRQMIFYNRPRGLHFFDD